MLTSRTRIGRPAAGVAGGPGGFAAHGRTPSARASPPPPGRRARMMRGVEEFAREVVAPRRAGVLPGRAQPLVRTGARGRRPGRREPPRRPRGRRGRDPALGARPAPAAAPEAALRKARAGGRSRTCASAASGATSCRFFRVRRRRRRRGRRRVQWGDPKDAAASTLGSRLALRDVAAVSRGHADENVRAPRERLGAASLGDPASAFSLRCPGRTLDLVAPNARARGAFGRPPSTSSPRARARRYADANANLPKKIPPDPDTLGHDPGRLRAEADIPAPSSTGPATAALDRPRPPRPLARAPGVAARASAPRFPPRLPPGSRASSPPVFTPAARATHGVAHRVWRQGSLDRVAGVERGARTPSPDPRRRPGADAAAAFVPVAVAAPAGRGEAASRSTSRTRRRTGGGGTYRGRGERIRPLGSIRRFANRGLGAGTRYARGRVGGDEGPRAPS